MCNGCPADNAISKAYFCAEALRYTSVGYFLKRPGLQGPRAPPPSFNLWSAYHTSRLYLNLPGTEGSSCVLEYVNRPFMAAHRGICNGGSITSARS